MSSCEMYSITLLAKEINKLLREYGLPEDQYTILHDEKTVFMRYYDLVKFKDLKQCYNHNINIRSK